MSAAVKVEPEKFICAVDPKRQHAIAHLTGHCETGFHASCKGRFQHPCGCWWVCSCTAQHPADRRHEFEEEPVLPSPFRRPGEPEPVVITEPDPLIADGTDAVRQIEESEDAAPGDWRDYGARPKPWQTGTGLDPISLRDTIDVFAKTAGDLHRISDRFEDYTSDQLLEQLAILRAAVRRASELDALLVHHLYHHGPGYGERLVDGLGATRVYRRDSKVKWDERGPALAIIDQHMEELGGETPDPYVVVDWLLEAASIGYYRKTALRAQNLDPDDYLTSEPGSLAVDVPKLE